MLVGSRLLVNVSDPELLEQRERKWGGRREEEGFECSLSLDSHFDRAAAEKAGPTVYTVTQAHNQNDFIASGQWRDQFNIWLSTENRDLPLLGFSCYRYALRENIPDRKMTLRTVSALIEQPQFFLEPVFQAAVSRPIWELDPGKKKMKILMPLHFSMKINEEGRQIFKHPVFQEGRIVDRIDQGRPSCLASASGFDSNLEYDLTFPAGTELRFRSSSSNQFFGDTEHVDYDTEFEGKYFQLRCLKKGGFRNASEIHAISRGLIEFN